MSESAHHDARGRTLAQKLFARKVGRPVQEGEILELPVDLAWGSEMTLKYAIDVLKESGCLGPGAGPVEGQAGDRFDTAIRSHSRQVMFPFDHLIPATDARSASLLVALREFAAKYGIRVFEVGRDGGIQHRLFEERGLLYPGAVGVGADSHSCTYGALGAIATGIGSTDLAAAMLTGGVWLQVPSSIRVELSGRFSSYVGGKDIVLYLLGALGVDGATYQALEFCGPGVANMPMNARFTTANMAVEGGAKFGLFAADAVTQDYLWNTVARDFPDEIRFDRESLEPYWDLNGDADAAYARRFSIDLDRLESMVSLPYSPENVLGVEQLLWALQNPRAVQDQPLLERRLSAVLPLVDADGGLPIQQIFIGSCTNGRIEDLREAAQVLRGRRVAPGVRAIIIPASQHVYRQALREGLMETFLEAGCYVESSSCGPCIGFKSGVLGRGETAIFTSNRNFHGRTGDKASRVLLAGPAVAAASAVAGRLATPATLEDRPARVLARDAELGARLAAYMELCTRTLADVGASASANAAAPEIARTSGALGAERSGHHGGGARVWCVGDDVNTDIIMPARFCNITDPAEYKVHVLEDTEHQEFLAHYRATGYRLSGDVLVAGKNFGSGSSRESAPMGIKEAGFAGVIAVSFARIFFRNAMNIGLPVLELGAFARRIHEGERLEVDFSTGRVENLDTGEVFQARPRGEFQRSLYNSGGLMLLARRRVVEA